jgi:hypothetical protein
LRWAVLLVAGVLLWEGLPVAPAWGEYRPKGKRDPFVPLLTQEGRRIYPPGLDDENLNGSAGTLVLQGIVFDPTEESFAIINDRLVAEQEEVEGSRVLKIEPAAVTILVDGEPQVLSIHQAREEITEP